MMVKSLLGKKAGRRFLCSIASMQKDLSNDLAEQPPKRFYRFMKSISNDFFRIIRDLIWILGRYDKNLLKEFIDEFNPDVVFCPRYLTPKLLRLERTVSKMTIAPFVAFTADDEASLLQVNYSPLYWIRRLIFRSAFRKHIKLYRHYFTFSQAQANEYNKEYGVPTSTLFKSGNFDDKFIPKNHNKPIRLVYAGRLYCNRWKTLAYIGEALKKINAEDIKMTLEIYTQETPTKKQKKALSQTDYVCLKGSASPSGLIEIYKGADIALHVESLDKKNRYATRVSFSTKIIDLMASSCAILAICWDKHAGYQYLKENDAAFCVSAYNDIEPVLEQITNNPGLISDYAKKAWVCGSINHGKERIQATLCDVLNDVVNKT